MNISPGTLVKTEYGIGRFQGMEDDTTAVVWIAHADWKGSEYPGKFNDHSPNVAVRVQVDGLERL